MKNFSGKPALLQHIAAAHPKGSGRADAGGKLLAVKDGAAGYQGAAGGGGAAAEEKQLDVASLSLSSSVMSKYSLKSLLVTCKLGHTCLPVTFTSVRECNLFQNPKLYATCRREMNIGDRGYQCSDCDYDVCMVCYGIITGVAPRAQVLRKRPTKQEEQRIRAMWRDWCDSKIAQCEFIVLTKRLPKRAIRISKTYWNQMKSDPSKYVSKSLEEVQEAMREIDEDLERVLENMDSDSD